MNSPDAEYLSSLDKDIYSLRPGRSEIGSTDPSLLLISTALRLLDIKSKRLDPVGAKGDIFSNLEFNHIYHRCVSLPCDLENGEYPLLLLLNASNATPYLLKRNGRMNQLLAIRNGQVCILPKSQWPDFADNAYELHACFRDSIAGIGELLRLAYKPELRAIGLLLLISALVLAVSLCIPILTNTLVTTVLPETNLRFLAECLFVVSLIVVASITSQYLQQIMILRLETIGNQRLQLGMWQHFLKLPISFVANRNSGDIYAGVSAISKIRSYVGAGALTSGLSALFSFAFLALMIKYSPSLAIWMIMVVALVLLVVFLIARRAISLNEQAFNIKSRLNGISDELSSSVLPIRALGAEIPFLRRWMHDYTNMAKISMQLDLHEQCIDVILSSLSPLGSVLLFAVAVWQVLDEPETIGDPRLVGSFIAFYSAFIAFSSSIADAAANLTDVFANVSVLWRKAKVILEARIEPGWKATVANHFFLGHITLNEVVIRPDGLREPLLQDISIDISPGSIVAILGKKASGKSLLLKTVLGLVVPESGDALVDGIPVAKVSSRGLRGQVGYVQQRVVLEEVSIRTLLSGQYQYPDSLIWQTLELLGLEERVRSIPKQLDAKLVDGGVPFSRGERKLLALARALLRKPAALLLDEVLVGLPHKDHAQLIDIIRSQDSTILMIPSHWSELEIVDHVVVLDEGRICFSGRIGDSSFDQSLIDLA